MKKVFVIGDSISIQYGPYLEQGLKGVMKYDRKGGESEALRDLDLPQGANGGDSARVLEYVRALKAGGTFRADIVLVNCGLHDIKRDPETGAYQVPIEEYRENLRAISEVLSEMDVEWIWMRTTPCDETVHNRPGMSFHRYAADCDAYNRAADEILRARGVPEIDLYTFTANLGGKDVFCDHVHFTEPVRMRQGAFLAGWLIGHAAPGTGR